MPFIVDTSLHSKETTLDGFKKGQGDAREEGEEEQQGETAKGQSTRSTRGVIFQPIIFTNLEGDITKIQTQRHQKCEYAAPLETKHMGLEIGRGRSRCRKVHGKIVQSSNKKHK
ncbi:uncharacterized protein LOC131051531 [Cryptomeria japonica]|uniref:uncharacterized protein LOC131051531 n=1 Tax=Cryptomeria japonica TaxID=3369 RepID=UPI0025AC1022|nr:uncharacterized protein LOC131051531 [Cryptomeria japonica]